MATLIYHIRPKKIEAFDPSTKKLIVEAGNDYLSILLWNKPLKQTEALEVFNGIEDWNEDWLQMEQLSELLQFRELETVVFYNTTRFIPIPSAFFNPKSAREQLQVFFGEDTNFHFGGDVIPAQDMVLVWETPLEIYEKLNGHFRINLSKCLGSLLVETGNVHADAEAEGQLLLSGKNAWIGLWRSGKLLLILAFKHETPDAISYKMLNACSQWGIENDKVNWQVAGLFNRDSQLWEATARFFTNYHPMNGASVGGELSGHFFGHLTRYLSLS